MKSVINNKHVPSELQMDLMQYVEDIEEVGDGARPRLWMGMFRLLNRWSMVDPRLAKESLVTFHRAGTWLAGELQKSGHLTVDRLEGLRTVAAALERYPELEGRHPTDLSGLYAALEADPKIDMQDPHSAHTYWSAWEYRYHQIGLPIVFSGTMTLGRDYAVTPGMSPRWGIWEWEIVRRLGFWRGRLLYRRNLSRKAAVERTLRFRA